MTDLYGIVEGATLVPTLVPLTVMDGIEGEVVILPKVLVWALLDVVDVAKQHHPCDADCLPISLREALDRLAALEDTMSDNSA